MKWFYLVAAILMAIIQITLIVGLVALTIVGQLTVLMCVILILNSLTLTLITIVFTGLMAAAED